MCNCLDKSFRGVAIAASTVFGLAGVGVAAGAGYLLFSSGLDFSQMKLLGTMSLKLMFGGGLAMLLFSIVGCSGIMTHKKVFLIPSMLILLCITIVHGVATVGVLNRRALIRGVRVVGLDHQTRIVTETAAKNEKTFLASIKHDYMLLASYCTKAEGAVVYMADSVFGKQFRLYSAYQCGKAQFIGDMASPSGYLAPGESSRVKACVSEDAKQHGDLKTLAMYCMARHEFADYINAVDGKQGAILAAALVMDCLVMIGMCFATWRTPQVGKKKEEDAQSRAPSQVAV